MTNKIENKRVVFPAPLKVILEETEIPKPKKGEVLIRTINTLISTGTECTALTGKFLPNPSRSTWMRYPFYAGYCNVGEIIELGAEVSLFKKGDIVSSRGVHTRFFVMKESELVKVPKTVSPEEASFSVIAAGVLNSVRIADVSPGDSVVVTGLGLLGQFACMWSRFAGGFPVIAVDISPKRLETAKKYYQANLAVNAKKQNVRKEIEKITKGRMADIAFEITGDPKLISEELKLVKRQGKFIILGSPRNKSELDLHDLVNSPSIHIMGTHFNSSPRFETPYNQWTELRNIELFLSLLETKSIQVKELITHRFSYQEAPSAYDMLVKDRSQALGVVLNWR